MKSQTAPKKLYHRPVLLQEVIEELSVVPPNGWIIDGTFGDGGHSRAIYEKIIKPYKRNRLCSVDWDMSGYSALQSHEIELPSVLDEVTENTEWVMVSDNFANMRKYLPVVTKKTNTEMALSGLLLDLGISSRQLAQKKRGFSFHAEGKVDMRMDPEHYAVAAYDLLNILPYKKMSAMFRDTVGMPPGIAAKLTKEILIAREVKLFGNSDDINRLTNISHKVVPIRASSKGRIHPATLLFLALRISVNTELQNLQEVLPVAFSYLIPSGRLLLMTYHSGEEMVVESFARQNGIRVEVILPAPREVRGNPRARSAKLYIITKK
ncbi:MAG: 16S rRNA (cytosine(1402)-N(4))-methyltransferase RsmH [Candidatus Dojkabacteria bacterium]|nr:MAG: 16S rRNA (cytosine(1402)-N(4))-methyltransferase RsmH [Candidatus Dojkabacteria bacterium]